MPATTSTIRFGELNKNKLISRRRIMKVKYLGVLLLALLSLYGCDDNTGTLGMDMLPDSDGISAKTETFDVSTKSMLADKVYSKTSTGYIGKFTDPDPKGFGNYEASFLAELNCTENFTFPAVYEESADGKSGKGTMVKDEVEKIQLVVYYSSWFGDSLNACRMSAYELNDEWLKVRKDPDKYRYTNIDTKLYHESKALGKKAYTAYDTSVPDSVRKATDSNGNSTYYPNITFPLDKELGNYILKLNRQYPEKKNDFFDNSDKFIENVFKGVYLQTDYGDGTILYVDRVDLQMQFRFHYVDSLGVKLTKKVTDENGEAGTDSTYLATAVAFASTKEVIQANKFENSEKLAEKVNNDNEKGWSYLKSPAGIFTEATLPYDEIAKKLANDTLNAVKLTFTNYKQDNQEYKFSMSAPQTVLLVRQKDMESFFVNNELADNVTSFVATHNSVETNQYTFKNIARLVSTCINEKKAAKQKAKEAAGAAWDEAAWEDEWNEGEGKNWNKVVLIPVVVTYDTSSNNPSMIGIQHDLKPTYAKLKGGDPAFGGSTLKIEVTHTSFNK